MPDRKRKVRRVYWDACVFLSYINAEKDRLPDVEALLEQARHGRLQILTSVLSVAEAAFGASEQEERALDPEVEAKIAALWEPGSPTQLIEFHQLIAERAVAIRRRGMVEGWEKIGSVDTMHLATAQQEGVDELQTYDRDLLKLDAPWLGFPIKKPMAEEPLLGVGN